MTTPATPRILPCGDAALAVEFGDTIDPVLNARVLELDRLAAAEAGVVETVPTYRSLLVRYDPERVGFQELGVRLVRLAAGLAGAQTQGQTWRIPVAYGGENGIDLEATAIARDITPDELVRRHAAPTYRVYMLGFLPGFAYLGGLDPTIATPRRMSPRVFTPAGTISIGGIQAIVASLAAPSGFNLLGRTPVRTFMPGRDPAVFLQPGDGIRFVPIDADDFARLDRDAEAGALVAEAFA